MRSTLLFSVLVASLFVLSGCIVSPDEDPDPTAQDNDPGPEPGDGPQEPDPGTGPDPAPEPASPHLSLVADNLTGTAPVTITFNLSSDDEDASQMDWRFDGTGNGGIDESGYGLPAEITLTYSEPGTFNATLYATNMDGVGANKTLRLAVSAPGTPTLPDPIVINGTITGAGYGPEGNEHRFNLSVPVERMTLTFAVNETAFDLDYVLYDPDGTEVDRTATENEPTGTLLPAADPPIIIEDAETLQQFGSWRVVVLPWLAVEGAYTITITFE